MIPNKNIFCNAPWFELQIYWNGALGFCCQEHHKIYPEIEKTTYNIKKLSIREWMDSKPMREIRQKMFGNEKLSICHRCYHSQTYTGTSRRHRSNSKSVIFTKKNFNESYKQSPHSAFFNKSREQDGILKTYPIDLHIDLGNYCNLACKMCGPYASSKIATQYKKWGIDEDIKNNNKVDKKILLDWTRDNDVWDRTLNEIASFENLSNVHFMGGETLLTKRFHDFIDFMIANNKTNFGISFVTNGTTIDPVLLEKLKKFTKRVNIEISIESITEHNDYIRQGTDTKKVLAHIDRYIEICQNNRWDITIRPAVSSLSVGYYHTLLKYCLEKKLLIKSLFVNFPEYLNIDHLPTDIKKEYSVHYEKIISEFNLNDVVYDDDYNESDSTQYKKVVKENIDSILKILKKPQSDISNDKLKELVSWCKKWDNLYEYNAIKLYPELKNIFEEYGYTQ